jgi:hypothetical protein
MKAISLLFVLVIASMILKAQEAKIYITGDYRNTTLGSFINQVEQGNAVQFFYDPKKIEGVSFSANFRQTSLDQCLQKILENTSIKFSIADNQVILYTGMEVQELFPGSNKEEETTETSPAQKKLSLEEQQKVQYRILNIGTPGKNKTGQATLSGYLKNTGTGEPISEGVVVLEGSQRGTLTDKTGFYSITLPVGIHALEFRCVGMESVKRNINLYSDGKLDISMEVKINLLEGATITEIRSTKGEMNSREKIDIQMMKTLPTLLGEADVLRSVLMLTGVQSVGEGTQALMSEEVIRIRI